MNEIIVAETGQPLVFPDPKIESAERAREFRALTPTQRFNEIFAMMAVGLSMARQSPRNASIESRWDQQEAEFKILQDQIAKRHGI